MPKKVPSYTVTHVPFKVTHLDQLKPEATKTVNEILARAMARELAKSNA